MADFTEDQLYARKSAEENSANFFRCEELKCTRLIPYDQVKMIVIRRRNAVWRAAALGALAGAVAGTVVTMEATASIHKNEHCGCGLPAALIIPPLAVLGMIPGALVGMLPLATGTPDPERPFESTRQKFNKYALAEQLSGPLQ